MKAPLLVIYYVGRDNGFRINIGIDMSTKFFSVFYIESKIEKVPRGIRGEKSSRHGKFEEFGLNNWSISKSQNGKNVILTV